MASIPAARLDEMIEATLDCHDDSEQVGGLFTMTQASGWIR